MATKSITITEEAYERLKAHKREGESFTDVINRLAGDDGDFESGFGMLAGEINREAYERRHEDFDRDFERSRAALAEHRRRDDE